MSALLAGLGLAPALWLVIVPLGAVPVVYLLRRWAAGALLAAAVCLATAWLALRLPHQEVTTLLGRPVALDALSAGFLALVFTVAAVLFLIAWRIPQGWSFFPFGLLALGLWTAASLVQHLGIAALLMELAAIVLVFIIQGGRVRFTRASWRFLVLTTLAVPLFLLAAWRIDLYRADINNAVYLNQARVLVAGGFALWLAVVPLHGWLTAIAAETSPLVAVFIFIGFPNVVLLNLLNVLADSPWLTSPPGAGEALLLAGLATALLGGLLAAVQRSFGGVLGYATLYDLGCSVLALGVGGVEGGALLVLLVGLVTRSLALTLTAAAGAVLRFRAGGDAFTLSTGLGRALPVTVTGLMVGGLALAGAPLTAGFAPRWLLLQATAELHPGWALWLSLAGLGVAVGYLRGLSVLLAPLPERPGREQPGEALLPAILIVILALLCLALGLFPQWLSQFVGQFATSFSVPIL